MKVSITVVATKTFTAGREPEEVAIQEAWATRTK